MVARSWIIGLFVVTGAVAWTLEQPQPPVMGLTDEADDANGRMADALLGVDAARERLGDQPTPADTLAAVQEILLARDQVRGHATADAQRTLDAATLVVDAALRNVPDEPTAHDLHAAAAAGQLHRLNANAPLPEGVPQQNDPLAALLRIAHTHDVPLDELDLTQLSALETLEPSLRDALGAVLVAFLGYQTADRAVEEHADLARVIHARSDLVRAAEQLSTVMETLGPQERQAPLQIANVVSIDLGPGDNTYDDHFMLLIDAGGHDVYRNNAGGSGVHDTRCKVTSGRSAAALIDLSGNDRYVGGLDCGANGGGFQGAGLLYDNMGDDLYRAGGQATNGGALEQGTGLILDVRGNDVYEAGDRATNGGADGQALGLIVDATGDDLYTAGGLATNGGGATRGIGALVDGAGDDTYSSLGKATNGGGFEQGQGLLVDLDGSDHYTAAGQGANGGATDLGIGALVDIQGADAYHATQLGSNGGGARAGIGMLVDHVGNDRYTSARDGVNGGAYAGGFGILFDAAGHDRYNAELEGVNGGAVAGTPTEGDPGKEVCPTNLVCFTPAASWGLLADLGGEDVFEEADDDPSGVDRSVFPKGIVGAQLDFVPDPDLPFGGGA